MKDRSLLLDRAVRFSAIALALASSNVPASADVTYSWSGKLSLADHTQPSDPSLIGPDGAEFVLLTTVSQTAVDWNPTQVDFAYFDATAARLWIDGEELEFLGGAQIDFSDSGNTYDIVTAGGMFRRWGQTLDFSSAVGLEPGTFSFVSPSETPPIFGYVTAAILGKVIHQPYITSVAAGTFVTALPEPSASWIISTALMLLATCRTRQRAVSRQS